MAEHPLKQYRADHKLTQLALAELLGVSKVTICRWEKGKRHPQRGDLPRIAERTGIAVIDLLGLSQTEAAE